jgi:hypothetical protein
MNDPSLSQNRVRSPVSHNAANVTNPPRLSDMLGK